MLSTLTLSFVLAANLAAAPARPTDGFRAKHAETKQHLEHLWAMSGTLEAASPAEQKKTMDFMVSFLKSHIVPHAESEEAVLYPAVDKRAAKGANPFTATMRYEHRIIGRWIDELAAEAAKEKPDVTRFARRADGLVSLIGAHFELEEEVLLPVLDKTMSAKQFESEVAARLEH